MKALVSLAGLLILLGCETEHTVGAPLPAPGSLDVLDRGGLEGDAGWWPSVTFDKKGQPHLSYCDAHFGDLKYATRSGAQWHVESALHQGNVGKYTSIAVAPDQSIAMVFYDQDAHYLRYAWRKPNQKQWRTENIAWGHDVGMAAELRFDHHGNANVFYYVPSGRLAHARRRAPGHWDKRSVKEATGGFSARIGVVLRPEGFWLTFLDWKVTQSILYLARPQGDSWRIETVADRFGAGWRSQLAFMNDQPVVLFSRTLKNDLQWAFFDKDRWRMETVINEAANFAASPLPDGRLVIAYEDVTHGSSGNGTVKYLVGQQGRWERYIVDVEGPAGLYLNVATSNQGAVVLPYYSTAIRGLKVYQAPTP